MRGIDLVLSRDLGIRLGFCDEFLLVLLYLSHLPIPTRTELEEHGNDVILVGRDSHVAHDFFYSRHLRVLFLIHQNRVIYTITTHTRPNVCRWTVELRCL